MAYDRKSYEAEIKGFLVSPSVIITGNILDALSGRHMQFLYNSYTEKHGKKFLKEVTLLGKMEAIAPDMGFGIGACGDYEGIASGDRQWFDKGKCEIEKWLKWNGGSKIRVPSNLRMCRRRANALIGDYNEWEKSHACGAPCLFKFLPDALVNAAGTTCNDNHFILKHGVPPVYFSLIYHTMTPEARNS